MTKDEANKTALDYIGTTPYMQSIMKLIAEEAGKGNLELRIITSLDWPPLTTPEVSYIYREGFRIRSIWSGKGKNTYAGFLIEWGGESH